MIRSVRALISDCVAMIGHGAGVISRVHAWIGRAGARIKVMLAGMSVMLATIKLIIAALNVVNEERAWVNGVTATVSTKLNVWNAAMRLVHAVIDERVARMKLITARIKLNLARHELTIAMIKLIIAFSGVFSRARSGPPLRHALASSSDAALDDASSACGGS